MKFWSDIWYQNCPLSIQFPLVYAKCKKKNMSLSEVWNNGAVNFCLTRGVSLAMRKEKEDLLSLLQTVPFSLEADSAVWQLTNNGLFSVNSMYKFLNSGGVICPLNRSVWALKIPLKFKLRLWLAIHNKLLTKENLNKRNWPGQLQCEFCSNLETTSHLFLSCSHISAFWSRLCLLHSQGSLVVLTSLSDLWQSILTLPINDFLFWGTVMAAVIWMVWSDRNNRILQNQGIRTSNLIFFSIWHLFSFWTGAGSTGANLLHRTIIDLTQSSSGHSASASSQQADSVSALPVTKIIPEHVLNQAGLEIHELAAGYVEDADVDGDPIPDDQDDVLEDDAYINIVHEALEFESSDEDLLDD